MPEPATLTALMNAPSLLDTPMQVFDEFEDDSGKMLDAVSLTGIDLNLQKADQKTETNLEKEFEDYEKGKQFWHNRYNSDSSIQNLLNSRIIISKSNIKN